MRRLLVSLFLTFFAGALGFAQTDLQPAAIVNLTRSEPITVKQYRTEVERQEQAAGRTLTATERRQVLDVMINERLAVQAADRDRVTITENELNQQIQQLRTNMAQSIGRQPTDAEFAIAVKNETGLEVAAFREQLRRQLLVQKYLQTKKQTVLDSIRVPTASEIQSTFDQARSQFVRPETIRFSMIQVRYTTAAGDKTKAKELADRLAREINSSPSKFDETVLRSQTANSGYQAGDFGYLPRNMEAQQAVGADFINTAFSLGQGKVSPVIESGSSYIIIKVTETYAMKFLELDDIVQLGTQVTVRNYIGNALLQEREQAVITRASEELVTELRAGKTFQVYEQNLAGW
jgi:parvulin-like peptidyl-prolyl isomerase